MPNDYLIDVETTAIRTARTGQLQWSVESAIGGRPSWLGIFHTQLMTDIRRRILVLITKFAEPFSAAHALMRVTKISNPYRKLDPFHGFVITALTLKRARNKFVAPDSRSIVSSIDSPRGMIMPASSALEWNSI